MITVQEATQIINAQTRDYGTELVPIERVMGRTLAEDILTDRELPPYDRVTMDGVAINYAAFEKGNRSFHIKATIAAGDTPVATTHDEECIELMTGCALPDGTDTVVRYEDLSIADGVASITIDAIKKGQNIHRKGSDKKQHELVVPAGATIDATTISMAASVGKSSLLVKKLPRVIIISTGDELVGIDEKPTPYQVRRSNSHAIHAVLQQQGIDAATSHIPDDAVMTEATLRNCLSAYDVIVLSGGISMGKFDHVPKALAALKVDTLFHKVKQRPGKPFWFGTHANGAVVFAFPGNPVSAFMCLRRYLVPWLKRDHRPIRAVLDADFSFVPALQYFLQVRLEVSDQGQLTAIPVEGNGSGDFSNLLQANAFMELPAERSNFRKGEVYPIWPFKLII